MSGIALTAVAADALVASGAAGTAQTGAVPAVRVNKPATSRASGFLVKGNLLFAVETVLMEFRGYLRRAGAAIGPMAERARLSGPGRRDCPRTVVGTAAAAEQWRNHKVSDCPRGLARHLRSLARTPAKPETTMKFEAFVLRSLFAACLLVCALTLVSMMRTPHPTQLAANGAVASLLLAAPVSCTLPADGLVCLRNGS